MHTDKNLNNTNEENLEFKAFYNSLQDGNKFLRSYYSKKLIVNDKDKNETSQTDNILQKNRLKIKKKYQKKKNVNGKEVPKKNSNLSLKLKIPEILKEEIDINHNFVISPNKDIKSKNKNTIVENLQDKLKYNKILSIKNLINRYVITYDNGYKLGKIKSINENNHFEVCLYENETIINTTLLDSSNQEIYLAEYFFLNKINNHLFLICSPIKNEILEYNLELKDDGLYYMGIDYFHNGLIEQKKNSDLISIENEYNINKLVYDVNECFKIFNYTNEYREMTFSNLNNYILYECIYNEKKYLILNYNSMFKSVYLKNYLSGENEWKSIGDNKIYINLLKGMCKEISILKMKSENIPHFYKNIRFYNLETIPIINSIPNILINKETLYSICKELDCSKCTYKIDEFEYNICKFCYKIYHRECLQNKENNSDMDWICKQCKPCLNCHTNDSNLLKLYCDKCNYCYHYQCLNNKIKEIYPLNLKDYFICENCLECEYCNKTIKDYIDSDISSITWSTNLKCCSLCEKRFEKKEYCPICNKLWKKDCHENMVYCKCKYWIHKECDRIITDNYFLKLTKNGVTYNCPLCRISKKNKHIENILQDYIKLDKNQFFYFPVDITKAKNYEKIIKNPMSFHTMIDKISKNCYLEEPQEFFNDFKLIVDNAKLYNMPNHRIHKEAEIMYQNAIKKLDNDLIQLTHFAFDYFIFDKTYSTNDNSLIEEIVNAKFINKVNLLKSHQIINKFNEYKINWPFIKEFIEKNCENSLINLDTSSIISDTIYSHKNTSFTNIINIKQFSCEEDIKDVLEKKDKTDIQEKSNEKPNDISIDKSFDKTNDKPNDKSNELLEYGNIIDYMCENKNYNFKEQSYESEMIDDVNVENLDYVSEKNNEQIEEFNINEQNEYQGIQSINQDQLKISFPIEPTDEEKSIPAVNIKEKKNKNKILKNSDFQQELDCYNSNFEINKKTIRNVINKTTSHKMEINENINELNSSIYLDEAEENIIKKIDAMKVKDTKLCMLYINKSKYYLKNEEYTSYLDLINSYITLKEDKKKKAEEIKNRKKSIDSLSDFEPEIQINSMLKKKKGRPKTKLSESENEVVKIRKIENIKPKTSPNMIVKPSISNSKYENKLKSDLELYDENINPKNLLPLPALITFSDLNFIYENNCYLCGSFDDQNSIISCSLCFENFHSYCISNSELITENIEIIKQYEWKCQNCKFCEKCNMNGNDSVLLYCDSCDRAFHTYCLDVPLHIVPETNWKCLSCFKCQNCGTKKYYKESFTINKDKDYSKFTRNFNYCYECGFKIFYLSMCAKCNISNFPNFKLHFAFINNKVDYMKESHRLNDEKTVLMVNCNECKNWFHGNCVGIDEHTLRSYFEEFDTFYCLDCYILKKNADRYNEITYIKYLEILKMSYIIMCFSKLIMIILKSITKNSNIKLHSKLLKAFLKENFNNLLKNKNMCMFLELIRMDIFLMKDKSSITNIKKTKIKKLENPLESNNTIPLNINQIDKMLSVDNIKKIKIDQNYINSLLYNHEVEKIKKISSKMKKNSLFVYDVSLNKNQFTKGNLFLENQTYVNPLTLLNYPISTNETHKEEMYINNTILNISEFKNNIFNNNDSNLNNKKRRLRLITEKNLNSEFNQFFKEKNDINYHKSFKDNKFINFYKFDINEYYNQNNDINSKSLINDTFEKIEKFVKLKNFSRKMQKHIFKVILEIIILLKSSLLKWMINQIIKNNENTNNYIQKNGLYQSWIDINDKILNDNPILTCDNTSEISDEEISKFLDYIDPLEPSPSSNIICEFCQRKGSRRISGRLLHIKNESWGHVNCIYWSKGVYEVDEGILLNVVQIMNKVKLYKCFLCRKLGATIICDSKKCGKYFHFACAQARQCYFSINKIFQCNKCANFKEENIADHNTKKRYIVLKNTDFVNDTKTSMNPLKLITKYNVGYFNKFGNTTVIKFFQVSQKDLSIDNLDVVMMKNYKNNSLLFLLNENGISISNLKFDGLNHIKELQNFFMRTRMLNYFEKTDINLDCLKLNSFDFIHKDIDVCLNFNKIKENTDYSLIEIENLNSFLNKIFSADILSKSKKINKKYNDWVSIYNISMPFNIILKHQSIYSKQVIEFSDDLTYAGMMNTDIAEHKYNKKESKNKLEIFLNTLKNKSNPECFKFIDYINSHQQMKISKRSAAENVIEETPVKSLNDKKVNKLNKQSYKSLERTMNTNIMDTDLPLAMKFRNYKALKPKVTIGPSTIHRNGLFALDNFHAGEIVIEYVGELITNKIADFREKEYNLKGFGDCYMFRQDHNQIIDATKYGNLARFINHCCDPNCSAQANTILEKKHIILYAKRNIKAGEEITYDYNFECESEKILCRCGAKNCLGRLN